jgi:hypothetical protein
VTAYCRDSSIISPLELFSIKTAYVKQVIMPEGNTLKFFINLFSEINDKQHSEQRMEDSLSKGENLRIVRPEAKIR